MVYLTRRLTFNAAHKLWVDDWSREKNLEIFGKCANPNWHGHNYELLVKVIGEINPDTGYVIDLKVLKDIIKEEVEERFDHKNLNLDCPEFENLNPSAENIAVVIYDLLRDRLDKSYEIQVRLYETERNFVEYPV